ncbi:UTRA domain-containing protein [Kineococcus sp. T13]|uniref:UTRA domain-containing protein n=1 Tax=Kineococcus vitellinus TaxID=2696565 RepID=UPI0014126889|nr:UTRA domain-containing protein [Kineococcus vitellinus]
MPYDDVHEAVTRLAADLAARSQVKFPPERELAARLGASRTTVRKALAALEERGVVRRVQGRAGGAFLVGVDPAPPGPEQVAAGGGRKVARSLNEVSGVPQMLRAQGYSSGTRVVAAVLEPAAAQVAAPLGLGPGDLVASILRVRFADGDTLSLERMHVSAQRFPALIENSLAGSMYQLLQDRYGVSVGQVEEVIEAAPAPAQVAALLGLRTGEAVLKVTRTAFDAQGGPFEHSVDVFRSDRTRLTVRTAGAAGAVGRWSVHEEGTAGAGPFTRT